MTEAPVIAADRFPVALMDETGAVMHPKARVIFTQPDEDGWGQVMAWTSPENIVIDTVYDRRDSQFGPKSQDWYVQTNYGELIVRTLGGCGCGDRLKHWTPEQFQPYRIGRPLR